MPVVDAGAATTCATKGDESRPNVSAVPMTAL